MTRINLFIYFFCMAQTIFILEGHSEPTLSLSLTLQWSWVHERPELTESKMRAEIVYHWGYLLVSKGTESKAA